VVIPLLTGMDLVGRYILGWDCWQKMRKMAKRSEASEASEAKVSINNTTEKSHEVIWKIASEASVASGIKVCG